MLGLQCTDSSVRAVAARKSGEHLDVKVRAEEGLSRGAIREGALEQSRRVVSAVRKLRESAPKDRNVTLCLSPELVHTHLLVFDDVDSEQMSDAIQKELMHLLPEDPSLYDVQYSIVRNTELTLYISVTAALKETLSAYEELCKESGLFLKSVTTTGRALGALHSDLDVYALVNAADAHPSIVVFVGGNPVDEMLLESNEPHAIIKNMKELIAEYIEDELPIMHVAVHGSLELYEEMSHALKDVKRPRTRRAEVAQAVTVEHALPELSGKDLFWGGVIAARLGKGSDVRSKPRGVGSYTMQYLLIGVVAIAAAQFLWVMYGGEIVGFWATVTEAVGNVLARWAA